VFEGQDYEELMTVGGLHEEQTVRWGAGQQEVTGEYGLNIKIQSVPLRLGYKNQPVNAV
jgi:hypothetical protein